MLLINCSLGPFILGHFLITTIEARVPALEFFFVFESKAESVGAMLDLDQNLTLLINLEMKLWRWTSMVLSGEWRRTVVGWRFVAARGTTFTKMFSIVLA